MSEPKIYAALAAVMSEVGAVTKAKKNVQQGYQFRGIDDVMAHVQQVLAAHGVVCVPRVVEREREMMDTKSGGRMASVRLLVDHTFFAADGSHVVCTTLGEAMDAGDKASNKAMSAALKYALTETLMIPTYEVERDTEEASPEVARTAPPLPPAPPKAPATPTERPRRLVIQDAPKPAAVPEAAPKGQWDAALASIAACRTQAELDGLAKAGLKTWPTEVRAEWGIRSEALRKGGA